MERTESKNKVLTSAGWDGMEEAQRKVEEVQEEDNEMGWDGDRLGSHFNSSEYIFTAGSLLTQVKLRLRCISKKECQ